MDDDPTPPEADPTDAPDLSADPPGGSWHADTGDGPPTSAGPVPYVEHYIATTPVAPTRRRWPAIVGILILLPIVAVLAVAVLSSEQRRADWKARALDAEADADDLQSRLAVTAQDAESLENLVPDLRDDMAATETRLATTAEELESVRTQSGAATLMAVLATDAADKNRLCLTVSDDLLNGILRAYERNTTLRHLGPLAHNVNTLCDVADESYAAYSKAASDRAQTEVAGITSSAPG